MKWIQYPNSSNQYNCSIDPLLAPGEWSAVFWPLITKLPSVQPYRRSIVIVLICANTVMMRPWISIFILSHANSLISISILLGLCCKVYWTWPINVLLISSCEVQDMGSFNETRICRSETPLKGAWKARWQTTPLIWLDVSCAPPPRSLPNQAINSDSALHWVHLKLILVLGGTTLTYWLLPNNPLPFVGCNVLDLGSTLKVLKYKSCSIAFSSTNFWTAESAGHHSNTKSSNLLTQHDSYSYSDRIRLHSCRR